MENAEKIRSFIALELPDEAREELARVIDVLKGARAGAKWVRPGSVHLTLKFLGDVPEDKIPAIAEKLRVIAAKYSPFELTLSGIGVFPGWNYAKVVWVGAEDGGARTKELAAAVEDAMEEEGFEKEKRSFSPHLTIGRIKTAKNRGELKALADSIEVRPVKIPVSRIVLFRSHLTPKGAEYTSLGTADFSG